MIESADLPSRDTDCRLQNLHRRQQCVSSGIHANRVVVDFGTECAHHAVPLRDIECIPRISELQLPQRPQSPTDREFVRRSAGVVSHGMRKSCRFGNSFHICPRRSGMRRAKVWTCRIVEPASHVWRQSVPLLHRQEPIVEFKGKVRELPTAGLRKQRRAGLCMPRHERRIPLPLMPCTAKLESVRALRQRRCLWNSKTRSFRPKQQGFSRVEVPVVAIACPWKEERAESRIFVRQRVDSFRKHAQFLKKLLSVRRFENGQPGDRRGAEFRSGRLYDRTATIPDMLEIP